ncbi:ATP-binding protein, partial [Aerosakkonemataceae cyanobacterium BLCC-F50]
SIWHIGMCSLMTTTIAVMPILIGAIVFVIWRSLRPLQKFTDAIAINSINQNTQANFRVAEMPVEIRPLLRTYDKDVVNDAVRMTEKFQHRMIQVTANSGKIMVKSERNSLLQVLIHLIDYAKPSCRDVVYNVSTTIIQLEQKDDLVIIQVSNPGGCEPGISGISHQPINLSDAHSQETLDLKLEIIDTLVRRMGGNVFVQSHPGQGSDFWLRFPAQ